MKFLMKARISIRVKITLAFLLTLCLYIVLTTAIFARQLNQATREQAEQAAKQESGLLISSIRSHLTSTRNISNLLMQNSDIRAWLKGGESRSASVSRGANDALLQTYVNFRVIESLFIFDNSGENVNISNHLTIKTFTDIEATPWYSRATEQHGGAFVSINASGTLLSSNGGNNISFIRQILDMQTFKPSGFLIINLNESFLTGLISSDSEESGVRFFLLDENGESIISGQEPPDITGLPDGGEPRRTGEESVFLYRTDIPELGWTVITSAPYSLFGGVPFTARLFLLSTLFSIGLYIFGSMYTAWFIAKPINRLIASMRGVREGRFEPVPPSKREDEFGQLEEDYNIMIGALNSMISQRVLMEKEKRKAELEVLNEQFKPHFLYNTLDSISYLILSGDKQSAYGAVMALSGYYRMSLKKGAETVPLGEEIDMIKNYLALQKIRYGDMIEDCFDIQPEVAEVPVLRNILQPLVENCVYHGIKPSGEPGRVNITAWIDGDALYVAVEDNGLGMTLEHLNSLNSDMIEQNLMSFGLRGTVKRLRLFYRRDDVCRIASEEFKGTKVTLRIPVKEGSEAT